jgi:hypothetical protein
VRDGKDEGGLEAEFVPAPAFYAALRDDKSFSGAGLNIEGALALDTDRIRLFQRGNADPCNGLQPIDASADFSWTELCEHLRAPDQQRPPVLENVRTYDIGMLDGVRLTFSDAEHLADGRVLFSASAEDPESGEIRGSVLGIIEAGGRARWTKLVDQDGKPFRGKIEGLTLDVNDRQKIYFVIDDDDENTPSRLFHAVMSNDMLNPDLSEPRTMVGGRADARA